MTKLQSALAVLDAHIDTLTGTAEIESARVLRDATTTIVEVLELRKRCLAWIQDWYGYKMRGEPAGHPVVQKCNEGLVE